ncbi:hypothetical protein ACH4A3_29355 [Streptomyces sp. NPDC018007]|uniref:hypothetical protein n=1 Tax=Streptomyces sp. NPDC018007 TaxID=3365029 RepID=UPI0037B9BA06
MTPRRTPSPTSAPTASPAASRPTSPCPRAQATTAFGYPAAQTCHAIARAAADLRARRAAPYLNDVAALHCAGLDTAAVAPEVQHPADDPVVAVLHFDGEHVPAPALVWDERHDWRTVPSRRRPLRGTALPPEGDSVRYLATGTTLTPGDVVALRTLDE